MDWIYSTLSQNKYCGNSVIGGVSESSLMVTIDSNFLCIQDCVLYIYKPSMNIV